MRPILDVLGRELLFFDGGMGTMLQQAGLPAGEEPVIWNLENPDAVAAVHRQYVEAGCRILKANTFGANGLQCAQSADVIAAGVSLARREADRAPQEVWVAMDIGPTGRLLEPIRDLPFDEAVRLFRGMAAAGEQAGADCILIETMSDTYELKAAVLAAREATRLPIFATLIFDEHGRLLTGGDIPAAAALLEGLGADAIGFNCGLGPEQMQTLLPILLEATSLPVIVNPNAGLPRTEGGRTVYDVTPEAFARTMRQMARCGVAVLGGCCGTTPAHLAAMIAACADERPRTAARSPRPLLATSTKRVLPGGVPLFFGSRVRTDRPTIGQAVRGEDWDALTDEALDELEAGADGLVLGLSQLWADASAAAEAILREWQSAAPRPLLLETDSPAVLERALRLYGGLPLVRLRDASALSWAAPLLKLCGGVPVVPAGSEGALAAAGLHPAAALYEATDTAEQPAILERLRKEGRLALAETADPDRLRAALAAGAAVIVGDPSDSALMQAWEESRHGKA